MCAAVRIQCLVLFLVFATGSILSAADVYVKAGATGKGTKDAPYGQLWKAVDRAMRGDVIHIAAGSYNGKGGSGCFTVKVPNLTIAGGYDAEFKERNPFKNLTILERAKDYKGDWTGLGKGIITSKINVDCSGIIIDGLVLNSASRNSYYADGKLNPKGSWKGELVSVSAKNIKIRNCTLLNPYGNGIYCTWQGEENEVTNCFVINTFYCAISTRSAQPDSIIRIANNTVVFCWFQPGKGGAMLTFVGNQGQTIIENNIMAFAQTEDSAGYAVSNEFGNEDTIMKNNVFFQCQGGYYKYMDDDKKNLLVWKKEDLDDLNEEAEDYMLDEAEGNAEDDPKLMPDKGYFEKFANTVASKPGKLKMDSMNQWRRTLGLPLQAEAGTARKNWGMEYPVKSVVPNLVSKLKGRGVQAAGPFKDYKSAAAAAPEADYKEAAFDTFKKGTPTSKAYADVAVTFKAGMGNKQMSFLLKKAPKADYICFQLIKSGDKVPTRNYVYGYILKGSPAEKAWNKLYKKRDKYNKKGGIVIKGRATYLGNDSYSFPVGVIVDVVSKK